MALFAVFWAGAGPARAAFGAYKADVKPADVFPDADVFGKLEGKPPAIAAMKAGKVAGYVFETSDIGYSGKPIKILVGLDASGKITGAKVTEHHEPILLVGISPEKLFDFVGRYAGRSILETASDASSKKVDVISGATVTAVVINDSVMRMALAVAKSRGIAGFTAGGSAAASKGAEAPARELANIPFEAHDWAKLVGDSLVHRLHLKNAEVDEAFKKIGVGSPEPYARAGVPEDDFIDLYVALASLETTGKSLLSANDYSATQGWLKPKQSAVLVAANGDYSFRGSGFVRGGIFDRFQLVQDATTILFKDKDYRRIDSFMAPGAPEFKEIGLFRIPTDANFDPAKPFRIELLAQRPTGAVEKAFTSFMLPYELPTRFLAAAAPVLGAAKSDGADSGAVATPAAAVSVTDPAVEGAPAREALWPKIWAQRSLDVVILCLALAILTLIFFFQDWLVKHRQLFGRLRTSFLLFSVLWLGLYAKAQLSVVNVLTFLNALITGFRWDYFLLEPLIFILWCATAVSLLFWGRGAYCGWLCPFGALQELLNHGARRLGVQQRPIPFYIHERLWALKYLLFLGLLAVSLGDMARAEQLAEVEPFKTVVLLRFMREWWFVLFALALLAAGLFVERFYCRYLCVLGGALAIPGRGRMFDWLKRRKQCGYECQLCAKQCTVQSIHPLGQINPNECIYCMHCQVVYWDDQVCPPLILKREGKVRKKSAPAKSPEDGAAETPAISNPAQVKFTFSGKEKANV